MKVYVVLEQNKDCEHIFCGVFASKTLAQDRINEIIKDHPPAKDSLYISDYKI